MITEDTVRHVAKTARLNLSDKEIRQFGKELSDVLDAFKVLEEADAEKLEPSFHPVAIRDVSREDRAEESLSREDALINAKLKENGFFKGPRIV